LYAIILINIDIINNTFSQRVRCPETKYDQGGEGVPPCNIEASHHGDMMRWVGEHLAALKAKPVRERESFY